MSAAVVQGDANAYGGTGEQTPTVVWETAPTTGNLLLAIITTYNDFGPTPDPINGWAFAVQVTSTGGYLDQGVYFKYAGESEPTSQAIDNSTYGEWSISCWEIGGITGKFWKDIQAIHVGVPLGGSTESLAAGDLTVLPNTTLLLCGFAGRLPADTDTISWTGATGWTEDGNFVSSTPNPTADAYNWGSGGHLAVTGGDEYSCTITTSASATEWVGIYIELGLSTTPWFDGPAVYGYEALSGPYTSFSLNLTTYSTDDVIFAVVGLSGTNPEVTSVVAEGLTFSQRYANNASDWSFSVWTAPSASALSAKTITANATGVDSNTEAFGLTVFGVAGTANYESPWDSNANLPYSNTNPDIVPLSWTTSNTLDMVIAIGINTAGTGLIPPIAEGLTPWFQPGGNGYHPAVFGVAGGQALVAQGGSGAAGGLYGGGGGGGSGAISTTISPVYGYMMYVDALTAGPESGGGGGSGSGAQGAIRLTYNIPDKIIIYFYPFNFGDENYIAVFFKDGTAVQVSNPGGTVVDISTNAGQFYDTSSFALPQCVQWEAQYLVIIASNTDLTNGSYYIWDGTNLYQAGTLAPDVNITYSGAPGSYTGAPTITAFGGTGSGAAFSSTIDPTGVIDQITVTTPGSGYSANDEVQLAFSGGGSDTSARAGYAELSSTSGVSSVAVIDGGSGFTTSSICTLHGGGGSGGQVVISGLDAGGRITQISVVAVGQNYTSNPALNISIGTNFSGVVEIGGGQVSSIPLVAGGSGYDSPPQVIIDPPNSSILPIVQAEAYALISGGAVTGFNVTNQGIGYVPGTNINVKLVGGNRAAAASVNIMPFGVFGNAIETYQDSLWIVNKNKYQFTAPGTTSDFAASSGGGAGESTDNFLREQYAAVRQSNGILYLLGDSSINGVSNVNTTQGSGAASGIVTTTLNNSNIDPQIGCAWRDTVQPFGRALMLANPNGVYALYGGAAQKVSQALDGLFANADFSYTPTAAVATLFGIPVYLFNFFTYDPYVQVSHWIMAAWDGQKWFTATQIKEPSFIGTQEINSQLTAWGTDNVNLYPMFQSPSDVLAKVFQSKLVSKPSHIIVKQVQSIYVVIEANEDASTVSLYVDTENAQSLDYEWQYFVNIDAGVGLMTPALSPMSQGKSTYGRFLGISFGTLAPDVTLVLVSLLVGEYSPDAPGGGPAQAGT